MKCLIYGFRPSVGDFLDVGPLAKRAKRTQLDKLGVVVLPVRASAQRSRYFYFDDGDREEIAVRRGVCNRLGYAIQLPLP
jgi:Domain of unknown function (DUF4158)